MHKEEVQVAESCAESQLLQRDTVLSKHALCNDVIVTDEYYVMIFSKMKDDNAISLQTGRSTVQVNRYILMNAWMAGILLWKRKV